MSKLENQIIELLSDSAYRPIDAGAVSKKLGITKRRLHGFHQALDSLIDAGKIREGQRGRLRLKAAAGFVTGVVKKISSGAGFVIPTERPQDMAKPDIFVDARDLKDAQTGDEVMVRLLSRQRSGGQRCGRVEKVLERSSNVFVGKYLEAHGEGYVRVDGNTFQRDIHVGDPGAKGAMPDDKVVIEMLRFPTATRAGQAVLTDVLGHRGDPGVDAETVIVSSGLPREFSESVLDDARHQADIFDETDFGDRLDLTGETIVTIDPASARDFDDAISLRRDKRGHWQLGVHIADVAHFVVPGSELDRSAKERGTSVYLPRHVIPMLPEVISNGLASLQEGQVRYTKSVFIEFDSQGNMLGSEVANTVIKVSKRFAYEEVMPIVEDPASAQGKVSATIVKLLLKMHKLAMTLRKKRFQDGALQMGLPEVEIDFDDDGNVKGAHERHHDESHEIIEEFMLAANIAVAETLASRDIPFLRRIHGTPDELRLKGFQEFCEGLGYELQKFQSRKEIQSVIDKAAGQPEERAVNFALLRSMKQAEYSPEDSMHYALNEDNYCHFTSPIRRYPDLTIHRIVGELARGKRPNFESMGELLHLGKQCGATERRAEKAERELVKIKLLRYYEDKVGEEMDAFITGVESFGMFCQGTQVPAEGMIHITALTDDFYRYNQASRTLTGEKTKNEYRLGDRIRVVVAAVDVDRRELDLQIVLEKPEKRKKRRGGSRKSSEKKSQPGKGGDGRGKKGKGSRDAEPFDSRKSKRSSKKGGSGKRKFR